MSRACGMNTGRRGPQPRPALHRPIPPERAVLEIEPRRGATLNRMCKEALDALESYVWPGNGRELQNYIERAVVMAEGDELTVDLLPDVVRTGRSPRRGRGRTRRLGLRDRAPRAGAPRPGKAESDRRA